MQRKYIEILTKEFLTEQYNVLKKSTYQIAKELNLDHNTIISYIEYWGLPRVEPTYQNRKNNKHPLWKGYMEISYTYWKNILTGARNRNLAVEIDLLYIWDIYIDQNRKCALSGLDIGFQASKSNTASLDRINSNEGYIKGNVQWLHRDINFMKQSFNNEEFIGICKIVLDNKKDIDYSDIAKARLIS